MLLLFFLHFTPEIPHGKKQDWGSQLRRDMEVFYGNASTFKVKVQKAVSEVLGQRNTVELQGSAEE